MKDRRCPDRTSGDISLDDRKASRSQVGCDVFEEQVERIGLSF